MRALGLQQPNRSGQLLLLLSRELIEPGKPFIGDLDLLCHLGNMPIDAYPDNAEMGPCTDVSAPFRITFMGCRRGANAPCFSGVSAANAAGKLIVI